LFYRVATILIEQAIEGNPQLSITDAVAALLQTWNQSYRYHKFDAVHFAEIQGVSLPVKRGAASINSRDSSPQ
jgi:hypothetical protein